MVAAASKGRGIGRCNFYEADANVCVCMCVCVCVCARACVSDSYYNNDVHRRADHDPDYVRYS